MGTYTVVSTEYVRGLYGNQGFSEGGIFSAERSRDPAQSIMLVGPLSGLLLVDLAAILAEAAHTQKCSLISVRLSLWKT